jgi:hypothetical protein
MPYAINQSILNRHRDLERREHIVAAQAEKESHRIVTVSVHQQRS